MVKETSRIGCSLEKNVAKEFNDLTKNQGLNKSWLLRKLVFDWMRQNNKRKN